VTEEQEIRLLQDVKSVTDHMKMVDEVFKQARLGINMVMVFQCGHSGLYYPGDFVREWGRLYGIGLGPHPVSECLNSDYYTNPPRITEDLRSIEQIMHPMEVTCAQVDYDLVDEGAFKSNRLVLAKDDPRCFERAMILRKNQLANPLGQLAKYQGLSLTEARWLERT